MKTEMCEKLGYRLIHIWENEWNNETKNKLIQIFEGKEKLPDEVTLINRDWYSINQFNVIEIIPASIEKKGMYHIENCGFFKIKGVK